MKLLMFDTDDFWYKTFRKTIDSVKDCEVEKSIANSLIIFINVENEDKNRKDMVVKKAVNNINWLAKKNEQE